MKVTLTNAEGTTVYSGTQSATSNDFGVVSLTVGNANTFKEMDWTKLPLFIEVSVDGKLIGKSQVLNVPVAEYAKKTGVLTYENIGSKKTFGWYQYDEDYNDSSTWTFEGRKVVYILKEDDRQYTYTGTYYIDGNTVAGTISLGGYKGSFVGHYIEETDTIYILY